VLISLAIGVFYAKGWFYLTGDIRAVVSSVPDDTAYFYKIAWNAATGKGLTFDGINLTNGFQPLWLYMLIPLAWLMREATPETYFRYALVYQTMMVLISGFSLFYAIRQVAATWITMASVSLFYLLSRNYFINGMETGVLMLCLTLLLAYCLRYRALSEFNPRVAFGFGLLMGLVLLARLDMIFLVGISYAVILGRAFLLSQNQTARKRLLADAMVSCVAIAIIVGPYFISNHLVFGAAMPISGQLKNSFPQIVQPEFGLERFRVRDLLVVSVTALFCIGSVLSKRLWQAQSAGERYFHALTLISAVTTLAHYFHTALFMKWAVFAWHFAFYYFSLCLIFCSVMILLFNRLSPRWHLLATANTTAFALAVGLYAVAKAGELYNHFGWHGISYEAALWARQNTPPDTVFAMKDAGIFGLFSQRSVINLDGLVNNMEYQEALRHRRLNRYLVEKGVEYLVQHATWSKQGLNELVLSGRYNFIELPYRSQRYATWSDPVRLYRVDEVFRRVYREQQLNIDTVFVIWRLRHEHDHATP
jgi:hypothetical protein